MYPPLSLFQNTLLVLNYQNMLQFQLSNISHVCQDLCMTISGEIITWYGLENGAEVYGYSDWRTFRNPVIAGQIMGSQRDSRGGYFADAAAEVLANHPYIFRVPSDFAPNIVDGKLISSEIKELGVRLLSGYTSSVIRINADLGKAFPEITIEPMLSGAKVEMCNASAPSFTPSLGCIICSYDCGTGLVLYRLP
jgi:hypothetical protein